MEAKLLRSLQTFFKYMLWTAIAAGIAYAANNLSDLQLPEWSVPIMGAILKAAATWIATKREE